jgi:X-X-X-Leu-X-X-Gly heptad repeat protein
MAQPIKVYSRERGDLSRVTDHSFVGVTSVSEPDGTQRATEIHVFPEELRGLGEGSRPMAAQSRGGRSTMTNGSVANSRMTNGAARMTNGAAQMTNGTSRGAAGGTMTVEYNGGSQSIKVPAGVTVTVITPTSTKLTPGTTVVIPANKQPDGSLKASFVMLTGAPTTR